MDEKRLIALVNQAQEGNTDAFSELYAEHARLILFNVRGLIYDKQNYDDVAQNVGVKLFEQIKTLREPAAFKGWMYQIIRSVCVDHNRKYLRNQERHTLEDAEEALDVVIDESRDIDPAAAWDTKLESNEIYKTLAQLSASYREVLIMRYYDDLSYKEIADALGISVNNVSARLHRATEAARQIMFEDENKEREGAFVEGDQGTKNSIAAAAIVLAPNEVVQNNVNAVASKIVATAAVAHVATAATKPVLSKLVAFVTVIALAAVATGVYAGVTWYVEEEASHAGGVIIHEFEGNPNIVFTDINGEDTQNNVKHIAIVEDIEVAVEVSYEITNAEGAVVLANEAREVDTTELSVLSPGMYHLVFTLIDANGAKMEVSRSFSIE